VKKRNLERHLAAHGCALVRQAAAHELWENPASGHRATVPRHREIKTPTARAICRQLGIPEPSGPR
jgi:mRNA interferase HicA